MKQSVPIDNMKNHCYIIGTDGSNDMRLKKMNPVTVKLLDINQHMVVTQFLEMCLSSSSDVDVDSIYATLTKSFPAMKFLEKTLFHWE